LSRNGTNETVKTQIVKERRLELSDEDDEIMTEMRNLTIKPAERGEIGMFAATSPV